MNPENPSSSRRPTVTETLPRSDTKGMIERLQQLCRTAPFPVTRNVCIDAISTIERLEKERAEANAKFREQCDITIKVLLQTGGVTNVATTPRTDAAEGENFPFTKPIVSADFARTLERELVDAWQMHKEAAKERDTALAAIELGQHNCDAAYEDLRKERDMAREQRNSLQQSILDGSHPNIKSLQAELSALKAGGSPSLSDVVKKDSGQRQDSTEVASGAHPDTVRLNWLEENRAGMNFVTNPSLSRGERGPHVWLDNGIHAQHFNAESYRAVIDKAMKPTPTSEEQAEAEDEAAFKAVISGHSNPALLMRDYFNAGLLAGRRSRGDS